MKYDLSKIKIGYLGLVEGDGGLVCNQIEDAQRREGYSAEDAKYTHVYNSLGGDQEISATVPLVTLRTIDCYGDRKIKWIVLKEIENDCEKMGRVGAFAATYVRLPYGVPSLFHWLIPKWMRSRSNWLALKFSRFCSQLADDSIKQGAGIDLWPGKSNLTMPARFSADKRFKTVDCLLKE